MVGQTLGFIRTASDHLLPPSIASVSTFFFPFITTFLCRGIGVGIAPIAYGLLKPIAAGGSIRVINFNPVITVAPMSALKGEIGLLLPGESGSLVIFILGSLLVFPESFMNLLVGLQSVKRKSHVFGKDLWQVG